MCINWVFCSISLFNLTVKTKKMKEHEKKEFERVAIRVIITIGFVLALSHILYFIFNALEKWH